MDKILKFLGNRPKYRKYQYLIKILSILNVGFRYDSTNESRLANLRSVEGTSSVAFLDKNNRGCDLFIFNKHQHMLLKLNSLI